MFTLEKNNFARIGYSKKKDRLEPRFIHKLLNYFSSTISSLAISAFIFCISSHDSRLYSEMANDWNANQTESKMKRRANVIDRLIDRDALSLVPRRTAIIPILIWLRPTRIPASDRIYIHKTNNDERRRWNRIEEKEETATIKSFYVSLCNSRSRALPSRCCLIIY